MRVAALYDIHGNVPALEAVLAEARREGVDRIVVGGDVVPGPMPRETLAALLDLDVAVTFLYGNGETDVLALGRGETPSRVPERYHGLLRWVAGKLPPGQVAAIESWPATARLEIDGLGGVLFCHATPRDDHEIFTCMTPQERLRPIFEAPGAAVVVCGHTHMAFDRAVGAVRVVNAGSVGMPFGEPGANWALLGPGVELRHTSYDLEAAARRFRDTGFPGLAEFDVRRPRPASEMLGILEAAALR